MVCSGLSSPVQSCLIMAFFASLGVIADPLRNYLLQNTSAVFEKSYQAEAIRMNPLRQRFPFLYSDEEAQDAQHLEQAMRRMVTFCDPDAPVEASRKYVESFQLRRDVSVLDKQIEALKGSRDALRTVRARRKRLIDELSKQAVRKMRAEYFDRVDRLRNLGQTTTDVACAEDASGRSIPTDIYHGTEALRGVANHIRGSIRRTLHLNASSRTSNGKGSFLELLVGYLSNRPVVDKMHIHGDESSTISTIEHKTAAQNPPRPRGTPTCLLCKETFSNLDSLTNHCTNLHVKMGAFSHPFPCPECRRCGAIDDHLISSPSSWSSHVELCHGVENAPKLRREAHSGETETKDCCPFCGLYLGSRGFAIHRGSHVRDGPASAVFSSPFHCMACRSSRNGETAEDVIIDGCPSWDAHVRTAHPEEQGWIVEKSTTSGQEILICLLCDDKRSFHNQTALTSHCNKVHIKNGRKFDKPFLCPECLRCGLPDHTIDDTSSWRRHVAMVHGIQNMPNQLQAVPESIKSPMDIIQHGAFPARSGERTTMEATVENRAAICFLCESRPPFGWKSNLTAHCKTKHVATGQFARPFSCPECQRMAKEDHVITCPSSWSCHVQAFHGAGNAPNLRSDPLPARVTLCPFCGSLSSGKHRNSHVREGASSVIFSKPFPCQACRAHAPLHGTEGDLMIDGCAMWNAHVLSKHGEHHKTWSVGVGHDAMKIDKNKNTAEPMAHVACLLCDGTFPQRGIWVHFMRTHLPSILSGSISSCRDCDDQHRRDGTILPYRIDGIENWNGHLQSTHPDLYHHFLATRPSFSTTSSACDAAEATTTRPAKRRKRSTDTSSMLADAQHDMVLPESPEPVRVRAETDLSLIDPRLLAD